MAVKKPEAQNANVVDVIWDGWLSSFKTACNFQSELEKITLEMMERQKELLENAKSNLEKMEEEMNQYAQEFKASLFENAKAAGAESMVKSMEDWTQKWEEIVSRMQKIIFTPKKAGMDVLMKSSASMESTVKNALDQQKKNREELQVLMENITEQIKQTHKGILDSFEAMYNYYKSFAR